MSGKEPGQPHQHSEKVSGMHFTEIEILNGFKVADTVNRISDPHGQVDGFDPKSVKLNNHIGVKIHALADGGL